MSTVTYWEVEEADEWGGRPVAHTVAEAGPRQRTHLVGVITAVRGRPPARDDGLRGGSGDGAARGVWLETDLDDATGTITLRWLGRWAIGGIRRGTFIEVEGTVLGDHGHLVILNPLYELGTGTEPC
jgi:hypothetical protein